MAGLYWRVDRKAMVKDKTMLNKELIKWIKQDLKNYAPDYVSVEIKEFFQGYIRKEAHIYVLTDKQARSMKSILTEWNTMISKVWVYTRRQTIHHTTKKHVTCFRIVANIKRPMGGDALLINQDGTFGNG